MPGLEKLQLAMGSPTRSLVAKGSMTKDEANNILNVKVLAAGRRIRRLVGEDVKLTDGQLAALVSLYFQYRRRATLRRAPFLKLSRAEPAG